jgi:hypothetical protein
MSQEGARQTLTFDAVQNLREAHEAYQAVEALLDCPDNCSALEVKRVHLRALLGVLNSRFGADLRQAECAVRQS